MAIALLGKCVALLSLVVLLYATCYGFRIRDVVPQTHHPIICVPAHGKVCPTDRTVTTGGLMYSARKWHESTVPRTVAGGRKPPAESTSDVGMERIQIEKITEHSRDRGATGFTPRSSRIESDEVDDDEEEEEIVVEVERVEEDEESVGDSERDQADGQTDEDEEDASEAQLSDQDAESKEKKVKKKFPTDVDDDKSEDNDDEDEDKDDEDEDEDDEDEDEDDEDEDEDKDDDGKAFKTDSKRQVKKIKTAKIVKSMKYSKSKADDDDDKEEEDDKEEGKKAVKTDQRKVIESLKKQFGSHKKQEEDDDEDKEPDEKETTPAPRKLEKVRLADKNRTRAAILPSKRDVEKPKQDDIKPVDVAKPAVESVKKTMESTKKIEPIEGTKKSVDSTKKPVESTKKLTEDTKKVESVKTTPKTTPKPKAEVPETTTKVDEKSKTRVKPETSTPAPKIKEQAKQPEKADVKKVTAKPTSKPSKEVSQAEKKETKPKTKEHKDASITLFEVNDAILRVPTFVPNFTNVENPECQQHGKIFLRQLRGYKLWALQMLDSSAKIPSGLLRGNVNQLGDYDQCLGVLAHVKVDEKTIRIQGKYCLATVDLHASHSDMRLPVNLMQARAFIRGNMHDVGEVFC